MRAAVDAIRRIARESPEGWGTIAQVLKDLEEFEPADVLDVLARAAGRDALPLLSGLAQDDDEELALAALRALPRLGSRAAAEALAAAYGVNAEGERGRLAREGVKALQARGINVALPDPAEGAPRQSALRLREAYASLPDPVGSRQIYARGQDGYGVWHMLAVVWNDGAGVKDHLYRPFGSGEWKRLLAEQSESGIWMIPVPLDFARWEIAQARQLNPKTGFPLDDNLDTWDRLAGPPPEDYEPPDPLAPWRDASDEEVKELAAHGGELFELPPLENWAMEPADCRPWLEPWRRLAADETVPDEDFDEEAERLYQEIVRELVTPEVAAIYRTRLVDAARKLLWDRTRSAAAHAAEAAAATAAALDRGVPPGELEFFVELAGTSLAMLIQMLHAGEDPDDLRYDPLTPIDDLPE